MPTETTLLDLAQGKRRQSLHSNSQVGLHVQRKQVFILLTERAFLVVCCRAQALISSVTIRASVQSRGEEKKKANRQKLERIQGVQKTKIVSVNISSCSCTSVRQGSC